MFWKRKKKASAGDDHSKKGSEKYLKYKSEAEAFLESKDYLNAWYNFLQACVENDDDTYCDEKRVETKKLLIGWLAEKYGNSVAQGFESGSVAVGMPKSLSVKMCGNLIERNGFIEYYETLYGKKIEGFKRWKVGYDENNIVTSVKLLKT